MLRTCLESIERTVDAYLFCNGIFTPAAAAYLAVQYLEDLSEVDQAMQRIQPKLQSLVDKLRLLWENYDDMDRELLVEQASDILTIINMITNENNIFEMESKANLHKINILRLITPEFSNVA